MALLRATEIEKVYPGVRALAGVTFDVQPGEIHALVGENGAGKSTLIKVFTGAVAADAGSLEFAGERLAGHDPRSSKSLGIAAIYQQPALFSTLTVAENLNLGAEDPRLTRRVNWRARHARAADLLSRVGASIDPRRLVSSLSMPEQQWVEIARALGTDAKLLILDEPTACLPAEQAQQLFQVLRELRAQGLGIVYITHRLEEVFALADRVTVLRDGATVGTWPINEVDTERLITAMVGRALGDLYPARQVAFDGTAEPLLRVRGLSSAASGLREISFDLRPGEILGLAGLVGSGRTELARALFGLEPVSEGEVQLRGQVLSLRHARQAVDAGIVYVPEDRRRHGIIGDLSNRANATLAVLPRLTHHGLMDTEAETSLSADLLTRLDVRTPSIYTPTGHLSGGNQQKVALARWLAAKPAVFIVDEPTQGVDVGAKAEIHRILAQLADEGAGVLLISSELNEVLGLADRVGVMREGRLVAVLERAAATPERVLSLALGQAQEVA